MRHTIPKLLWFLICGLLLSGCVSRVSAQDTAGETLTFSHDVSPQGALVAGEGVITVQLTVTGDNSQCPPAPPKPLDIVLVLDRSSSMNEPASDGSLPLDALKVAAKGFLDAVQLNPDRVGIVEFNNAASIVQSLSAERAAIEAAIDAIQADNNTQLSTGIFQARSEILLNSRPNDNDPTEASHVMIVFTDGDTISDDSQALREAAQAKQAGIRIITVSLGAAVNASTENLLRSIASNADEDYFNAPTAADLSDVYDDIGRSVREQSIAATNLRIEHTYNATSFELIPDSISGNGQAENSTIHWELAEFPTGSADFSYQLRALTAGSPDAIAEERITYSACGITSQSPPPESRLPVQIDAPTATPTPTPTITPTPSPTPIPTATMSPTFPPVEPLGTRSALAEFWCNPQDWGWLLALLLLLFLLWWLYRVFREYQKPAEERNPCPLIWWWLLPWLLFLLWRILTIVGTCQAQEAIYFWRIDNGQTGIWTTEIGSSRPAEEFSTLNESASCVGCHSVSSSASRIAAITEAGGGPVVVYDLAGQPVEIPPINGSFTSWSPDGNKLAVSTDALDIAIVDLVSQTIVPLAGASDPSINEAMPAWSADGQTIAFVRAARASSAFALQGSADIYTVPAMGGSAEPLAGASGDGMNYYPAYSPDGNWLAFTRHNGTTSYAAPEAEIFLVAADGGERERLAANDDNGTVLTNVSNSWTTWSLDGSRLAFNSRRNGTSYDLFTTEITADGKSRQAVPLTQAADAQAFEHLPFWSVPPERDLVPALLGLWPWLLFPLLLWLLYWLCRRLHRPPQKVVEITETRTPPSPLSPLQLKPLWQVAPTLIVGVGGTGRWVLTHLKKNLLDGGLGVRQDDVHFVLLDTSEREENNRYRSADGQMETVSFGDVSLDADEILLLGQNMSDVINRANDVALEDWFPADVYRGLGERHKNLGDGTHGRRPMARAGLIDQLRDGESEQSAAKLWQTLVDGSAAVRDDKLIRVIVVGSLAGGMSGTLFDVAHLARKAAESVKPEDGSVHIEAYFTTHGVFRPHVDNYERLQINTYSSARELQRFQLTKGLPFPMTYSTAESAANHLRDDAYELFDDVTLFGADGEPEQVEGKSAEPWATTFASMSDVLAFRLDKATGAGNRGDYRTKIRADVATKQRERNQAVVSAAGSYVYRLPLVDILHVVQTRWAEQLLRVFLMGNSDADGVSFSWEDADMAESPDSYARNFLSGQHPADAAPAGLRATGFLINGQKPLPRDVVDLSSNAALLDSYDLYLSNAIALLLNGDSSTSNFARRAPLLGFTEKFLESAETRLTSALQTVTAESNTASEGSRGLFGNLLLWLGFGRVYRNEWNNAAVVLTRWLDMTRKSRNSLSGVRDLLMGVDGRPGEPGVPGLFGEIRRRRQRAEQRREQLDQVAVRRYLWERPIESELQSDASQDLALAWYEAIEPKLEAYLNRFFWHTNEHGQVTLQIIGAEGQRCNIALTEDEHVAIQQMADEISQLAAYETQTFAENVTLSDVLETQLSTRSGQPAADVVRHAWQTAQPHLDPVRRGAVIDGQSIAAAGLPRFVRQDERFAEFDTVFGNLPEHIGQLLDPVPTDVIETSDRTAFSVVRENTLMPMMSLNEMAQAATIYARNAGSQQDMGVDPTYQSAVFAAESRAGMYERRLEYPELLDQDYRLLHPLIVWSLARRESAELYALAFAAGWVTVDQRVSPNVAVLMLPDGTEHRLTLPTALRTFSEIDARVAGLVRIVAEQPEDDALRQQLRQQLATPSTRVNRAWQDFVTQYRETATVFTPPPPPQCIKGHPMDASDDFCGECGSPKQVSPPQPPPQRWEMPFIEEAQVVQDLAAMAALMAYRRLDPENWEKIVMRRARRAQ